MSAEVEFEIVSPVRGLSTVGAQIGDRLNGYRTVFVKVGTRVNNVYRFPYEFKKFYADLDGVQHVFPSNSLKKVSTRKVKDNA